MVVILDRSGTRKGSWVLWLRNGYYLRDRWRPVTGAPRRHGSCLHLVHGNARTAPPASHPLWQHQLGLLLESTGEGIFGIDLDGHCMFINRAGAQMLGHEARRGARVATCTSSRTTRIPTARTTPTPTARSSTPSAAACPAASTPRCSGAATAPPSRSSTRATPSWTAARCAAPSSPSSTSPSAGARPRRCSRRRTSSGCAWRSAPRELSDALAQLRELSAWLDKVREDERTRIAREVHDELGSLLVALEDGRQLDRQAPGRAAGARRPTRHRPCATQMRCKCHEHERS